MSLIAGWRGECAAAPATRATMWTVKVIDVRVGQAEAAALVLLHVPARARCSIGSIAAITAAISAGVNALSMDEESVAR